MQKHRGESYGTIDLQGNVHYHPYPEGIRGETSRQQQVSFLAEMGQTACSRGVRAQTPEKPDGAKRLLGQGSPRFLDIY